MINLLLGDALTQLRTIETGTVDMCITSPPYYMLRDYGIEGQLGMESTVEEYISNLADIFSEVYRTLKPTGSCWINISDTYGTDKGQLCVPERLVLEMISSGWVKRNTIIWYKPSCLPSSAKDRFTNDFEYLFFFVKQEKYYFEQQLEPYSDVFLKDNGHNGDIPEYNTKYPDDIQGGTKTRNNIFKAHRTKNWKTENNEAMRYGGELSTTYKDCDYRPNSEGRNKRAIWAINPARTKEAHFATFPEELIITPIKAGCPKGGVVLDPFAGIFTTAITAHKLQRDYIMVELNPEYFEMGKKRLQKYTDQRRIF